MKIDPCGQLITFGCLVVKHCKYIDFLVYLCLLVSNSSWYFFSFGFGGPCLIPSVTHLRPRSVGLHLTTSTERTPGPDCWSCFHRLTVFIHLLFCCRVVNIQILLHPRDARLRLALINVPAPGRTVHVLKLHRNNLIGDQEFIFKVVLQLQNILHWKGRRGGWTGMHPQHSELAEKWFGSFLRAVLEPLVMLPDVSLRWLMTEGLWRFESVKCPAKERDLSVTPLQNAGQHPGCAHSSLPSHLTQEHLTSHPPCSPCL